MLQINVSCFNKLKNWTNINVMNMIFILFLQSRNDKEILEKCRKKDDIKEKHSSEREKSGLRRKYITFSTSPFSHKGPFHNLISPNTLLGFFTIFIFPPFLSSFLILGLSAGHA